MQKQHKCVVVVVVVVDGGGGQMTLGCSVSLVVVEVCRQFVAPDQKTRRTRSDGGGGFDCVCSGEVDGTWGCGCVCGCEGFGTGSLDGTRNTRRGRRSTEGCVLLGSSKRTHARTAAPNLLR